MMDRLLPHRRLSPVLSLVIGSIFVINGWLSLTGVIPLNTESVMIIRVGVLLMLYFFLGQYNRVILINHWVARKALRLFFHFSLAFAIYLVGFWFVIGWLSTASVILGLYFLCSEIPIIGQILSILGGASKNSGGLTIYDDKSNLQKD